jgi:hypothetical protein
MVLGHATPELILDDLFEHLEYPFESPWDDIPQVPSMDVIVDYMFNICHVAMVPFEKDPVCTPHLDCKPVPVWYNSTEAWLRHLAYGEGVIECVTPRGRGHMVAWNGKVVYDPQGYIYPIEEMETVHKLTPRRFWLCS